MNKEDPLQPYSLFDPEFTHDNCGVGAVVDIHGVKTHALVDDALKIVERLEHRAGRDAEGRTGDGVGILLQISHKFFKDAAASLGITLKGERDYAVGMFFLERGETERKKAMELFEAICLSEGLNFLGWRKVPTSPEILGSRALSCMPSICQCFIERPERLERGIAFDRKLYVVRRIFEQTSPSSYVCSLSSRTIVYKGMFLVDELRRFYPDLTDPSYESAIGLVHSRFSTNTLPSWDRAHPYRYILHNGEINTIRGNVMAMLTRERYFESPFMKDDLTRVMPIIDKGGSDSGMMDNCLEFLMMSGMDLAQAVMILIPEPWSNDRNISREQRDFYQYYSTMLEPWDGPASVLFSDGDIVGATLDRNGLRPSRYYVTKDGRFILASEVGVLDIPDEDIVTRGRLGPAKMMVVDTLKGEIIDDASLKRDYASRHPYGEWLDNSMLELRNLKVPNKKVPELTADERMRLQLAFGYRREDVTDMILPLALNGAEPSGAMGCDTPIAALDRTRPLLFSYFKQMFAQVTNPPFDSIREKIITATNVYVGAQGNVLEGGSKNCSVLKIDNPILDDLDILKIKAIKGVRTLSLCYYKGTDLEKAIEKLFVEVDRMVLEGANILILSDRGVDKSHVAIPSLLAAGGVINHLVRTKKLTSTAIILETGEPKYVHDFATLIGYGAAAVNPYLAYASIRELIDEGMLDKDYYAAVSDYKTAIRQGIVKIASKMGISTIHSYRGSQIFEALGISKKVVDRYFTDTVTRVGGIELVDIAEDVEYRHFEALSYEGGKSVKDLPDKGTYRYRSAPDAAEHLYNPSTVKLLREAAKQGDYERFKEYSKAVESVGENGVHLRSLLEFNYPLEGVPIEEVEPEEEIVKRFKIAAMSFGALSKEAHECLAEAANTIGAKSNSGEGGEFEDRYSTIKNSAAKQVASGRFGVTSKYLCSASEIQIKIAQGAKPGEGGQLPGSKVYPWIAAARGSTTGIGLISPPPHHDIYSIEDLAELIYDLKCANRRAAISVKLVSEAGVGTIASGVAKAGAEGILISGYDGGTGAAPVNSIYNAGLPLELGLAETHQSLILNGLRQKVRIEADSKLMNGRDLAIAAMLGAEEFAFGTGPLVAMGCCMDRVCNRDTCPMGICTQNPDLRKRFKGCPEDVINFLLFMARELREYMAALGVRTVDELVGRTDLLKAKKLPKGSRAAKLDLSVLLSSPLIDDTHIHFEEGRAFDMHLEETKDLKLIEKKFKRSLSLKHPEPKKIEISASNKDRALGTIFGSDITKKFGSTLPEDTFRVVCRGTGGQSFGAFIPKGLTMELIGDANDYFGKGLSGGKIIVYPPSREGYLPSKNIAVGNVALFGATSGKAFINGSAGERFAIRNSGATAVVEGVGDHGLEYMTGGTVVVLGRTGKNFAAGMSGGVAYVLDEKSDLYLSVNKELVKLLPVEHKYDVQLLRLLIAEHVKETGSSWGKKILNDFSFYLTKFKKVMPRDYERMIELIKEIEKRGIDSESAGMEAFLEMK